MKVFLTSIWTVQLVMPNHGRFETHDPNALHDSAPPTYLAFVVCAYTWAQQTVCMQDISLCIRIYSTITTNLNIFFHDALNISQILINPHNIVPWGWIKKLFPFTLDGLVKGNESIRSGSCLYFCSTFTSVSLFQVLGIERRTGNNEFQNIGLNAVKAQPKYI